MIDATGVTDTNANTTFKVGAKIKFDNGLVYSSAGQVIDPVAKTLLGTFSGVSTNAFVPDSTVGRAYNLPGDQFGGPNVTLTLKAFDTSTFLSPGSLAIPGVNGRRDGDGALGRERPGVSHQGQPSVHHSNHFDSLCGADSDTFAAGELSKTFTVPILDDTLYEGVNETFNVTLSNPTGGASLNTPSTTVVTIYDNDQKPSLFITSSLRTPEGLTPRSPTARGWEALRPSAPPSQTPSLATTRPLHL